MVRNISVLSMALVGVVLLAVAMCDWVGYGTFVTSLQWR